MSSAGPAEAAAAMAVDHRGDGGVGEHLGPEKEIDSTLAGLMSAS